MQKLITSIQSFKNNWWIFIQERFPIVRHLLLIIFLFLANIYVAIGSSHHISYSSLLLPFSIILLTFLRLRIFDEIKDYKNDLTVYPSRPLAKGLINLSEAKKTAFILLSIELILSSFIGMHAFIGMLLITLYSLLMYKEFFVSQWLHPKLATYALSHTIVSSLISLFIFSSVSGKYFWEAPKRVLLFALANWMIFNVFEFGRKTFSLAEEKVLVDSYSKKFGSWGAALCVITMALIALIIAVFLGIANSWTLLQLILLSSLFLFLLSCSFIYGYFNCTKWALRFRFACSSFILFYNLFISLGLVI